MNIIIPMAGSGQRFVDAGYKDPKPMIMVGGKRIIEYILDMFDRENDNFIFICNNRHLADNIHMKEILQGYVNKSRVIGIPCHKKGPVYTVYTSIIDLQKEDPVVIAHCDTPVLWDYDAFKQYVKDTDADGCIISHTGFHPHTLASTMMAYSMVIDGRAMGVKEKACFTSDKFREHASSGTYYFKKWDYVLEYFYELMEQDITYNGEYYITLAYNLMIQNNLRIYSFLNDYTLSFNTPSDLQNYEAWQKIIDGDQVKNEEDLFNCYNYWKSLR